MARPLPSFTAYNLPFPSIPTSVFFALIVVFSIFSIITFLCGSKRSKNLKSEMEEETASDGSCNKDKKLLSKLNSNISSKTLSMVRLISWKKIEAEKEEEEQLQDDDDEALWRKTILMGERCRPLDSSGETVYDDFHADMLPDLSH